MIHMIYHYVIINHPEVDRTWKSFRDPWGRPGLSAGELQDILRRKPRDILGGLVQVVTGFWFFTESTWKKNDEAQP
jgi:hypothetical protein